MTPHHHTIDVLHELGLTGMAAAYEEQLASPDIYDLSFDERLGLLVDREAVEREGRRLASRLRSAHLRESATIEDVDFHHPRGLDKAALLTLAQGQWVEERHNILITGPTGTGKSYLACAFAHKAIRQGHTALYVRLPRLLEDLAFAHGDGRYLKLLTQLAKVTILVIDDFGLVHLSETQSHDILEVLEDRYMRKSTIITSQLPTSSWYELIADPTVADAMLDRLVHNAYTIAMKGDSMRKYRSRKGGVTKSQTKEMADVKSNRN